MSLISSPTSSLESGGWIDLGTYRVNVNRGHGMISCFLLLDAVEKSQPIDTTSIEESNGGFHIDELERQMNVDLTVEELEHALETHQFGEIKWMATASRAVAEVKKRIAAEDQRIQTQLTHHRPFQTNSITRRHTTTTQTVEHAPITSHSYVDAAAAAVASHLQITHQNRGNAAVHNLYEELKSKHATAAASQNQLHKRHPGKKGSYESRLRQSKQ